PPKSRVAYIFSPPPERLKGVSQFFERFRDPKMTFIYQVGIKIAMISSKEEVEKLLALYEAVWEKENEKVTRVFTMHRLPPEEMEKIVKAYFEQADKKRGGGLTRGEGEELSIFPLKEERSLVVIGPKDMVDRAEKLIVETERQIEDPKAMTVFWYTCRHSDPIEVAEVLEKVYASLLYSGVEGERPNPEAHPLPPTRSEKPAPDGKFNPPNYGPPPYSSVVNPPVAVAGTIESQKKQQRSYTTNFIPYPKTGSIMMVVQRDILEKIKELLKKIDVPKKMVQIEVLLFEKRVSHQNNFGLSFLKLGAAASNTHKTGFSYSSEVKDGKMGIVDFFLFRTKPNAFWPAYDIAYNFLMSQEDVRINASPSVTTLNQTPATIAIVDEISIDNGAAPIDSNVGTVFQKSFSRAQYGTTIVVTPTVHEKEGIEEEVHFVTLETDISFDTIKNKSERPEVNRRHIENQVRVMDGETVILGGLRRKSAEDRSSKLPFLGELPGIGKFFGESKMDDQQIELFIFITPHIIFDKKGDFAKVRYELLKQRPGDIPEFLEKINEAKKRKKERLFDNSLKLLFGKVNE
ncbi:MAG: type II secretion system protein GspD, partial [Simkania negevensis]|nr:type II secretion system protein GspD [Simkania negevensis]